MIIDHQCTDISQIPLPAINLAKQSLSMYYLHTSHGRQPLEGMACIEATLGAPYQLSDLSLQEALGDLGSDWDGIVRSKLADNDVNVVIISWCGQVSGSTEVSISAYLNTMNQLEIDYPDVFFVYMTGHLDGTGIEGNLNVRNNQIREYCVANNKFLFDFADIESYDPDGRYVLPLYADDNCDYDGGNWAAEWCAAYPSSDLCGSCICAHSQPLNCSLKGRAFWWMLAELAGWSLDPLPEGSPAVYVVPAITNDKLLPTTAISDSLLSDSIVISGCAGEFVPATFVVKAVGGDIPSLLAVPSIDGIPDSAIDMYAVKVWWQARGGKHLTPELLLKNDALIRVENGENYLDFPDGGSMWISDPTQVPDNERYKRWTAEELPVWDSETLQPAAIPNGTNKQFWVLMKIPKNTSPGTYDGTIELRSPTGLLGVINLTVKVLPIDLLETYLEYSIYYAARLTDAVTVSSQSKTEDQMRVDLQSMWDHGIKNPNCYQGIYEEDNINLERLGRVLDIRNEIGMGNRPLYFLGLGSRGINTSRVEFVLPVILAHGYTDGYFYGIDEILGQKTGGTAETAVDACLAQRPSWEETHRLGGKVFVAGVRVGHYSDARSVGEFGLVGDLLDLFVCHGMYGAGPSAEEAARWHSEGQRIVSYSDPVIGQEMPDTYRRNYGLSLWQGDHDGTMPWAYNYATGNPWNDFDSNMKQMFGYPTINGVVDNLAFEGWREGVTDTRYLTTLLYTIDVAKQLGRDTTAAENYLTNLKAADRNSWNLDEVRLQMTNHILSLQGEPVPPSPGDAALSFNGISPGGVNCGNNECLNLTDELTIEVWIKPEVDETQQEGNSGPICKAKVDVDWSWQLRYRTTDSPEGWLGFQFNADPEGPTWVSTNQNLIPGRKYYIVGRAKVLPDGLLELSCFVDGQLTDSAVISAISGGIAPLLIGQDGWDNVFNGVIDEVRISRVGRSDAEISANWNNGQGRKLTVDQHTVALWHMDEGQGPTIYDEAVDVNDGTIIAATWVKGFGFPEPIPVVTGLLVAGVLIGILAVIGIVVVGGGET